MTTYTLYHTAYSEHLRHAADHGHISASSDRSRGMASGHVGTIARIAQMGLLAGGSEGSMAAGQDIKVLVRHGVCATASIFRWFRVADLYLNRRRPGLTPRRHPWTQLGMGSSSSNSFKVTMGILQQSTEVCRIVYACCSIS